MDTLKFGLRTALLACASLLISSCATMNAPMHDFCILFRPIYLAKGEAAKLSDATARQILTINETYLKVCGKQHE